MITEDKVNEFVLIDNNNSKFSIKLKDDIWSFVIDDDIHDELSCGISRFSFKSNNNQTIIDLIANLFNEIGRNSNVKGMWMFLKPPIPKVPEDIDKAVSECIKDKK